MGNVVVKIGTVRLVAYPDTNVSIATITILNVILCQIFAKFWNKLCEMR